MFDKIVESGSTKGGGKTYVYISTYDPRLSKHSKVLGPQNILTPAIHKILKIEHYNFIADCTSDLDGTNFVDFYSIYRA